MCRPVSRPDALGAEPTLPAETGGAEVTRFNALRHGVLSRYTVLPWEDDNEYRAFVSALVAEYPSSPGSPLSFRIVDPRQQLFGPDREGFVGHKIAPASRSTRRSSSAFKMAV
jgi:hypothetical protein